MVYALDVSMERTTQLYDELLRFQVSARLHQRNDTPSTVQRVFHGSDQERGC